MPRPRKLPRTESAAAAYDAMMVAAERVLAEDGAAGLTTNRIAEVAGVSIGSLYQYFPNKEAVAAALIERYDTRFFTAVGRMVHAHRTDDPPAIMTAIGGAIVDVFRETQPIYRHIRDLRAVAGKLDALDRALDDLVAVVAAYLRTRPEVRADPDIAAFAIVHAVDGVINAFAIRKPRLQPPIADADALVRALALMFGAYLTL